MKNTILILFLNSLFIALMAQWSVVLPTTDIKMSLLSLSISLSSIFLMHKAWWGVTGYLVLATLGLPVLAGGESNKAWFLSPKAGYYIGFLIASLIVGNILKKYRPANVIKSWLCLSLNEGTILFLGWLVMSLYTTPTRAWEMGVYPFIIGACLKITLATLVWMTVQKRQLCRSVTQ